MQLFYTLFRRPRFLRTGGFGLLVAVLLLVPQVQPSQAAPVGSGWSRAAGIHAAEHFVGQYKDARGQVAYCTDFERLSPENSGTYGDGQSGGFVRSDGSALSTAENAALSYLLHRWGATADDATAASVQLAVWALTSPGMSWDSPGMNDILQAEQLPAGVVEQARSMTRAAFSENGPYTVKIQLEPADAEGNVSTVVSVVGANGEPAAGLAAAAELTGPFAVVDGAPSTWTSSDEPQRLSLRRTGLGSGSITVTVPRTPAAGVQWLVPSSNKVQRLLLAAVVEPRDAAAAIADLPSFQPAVETRTSAARTEAGSAVHDVLTVSSAPIAQDDSDVPGPWLAVPGGGTPVSVEVVSTLWGPLDAEPVLQEDVPAETPNVGTVTTRVAGPGTYTTAELVVPSPGWYVWTESIAAESTLPVEAAPYVLGWQGQFGIAAETTFVPFTPGIRTQLSANHALVGDQVTDAVIGEGFGPPAAESGGTVRLAMYGPLTELPSPTAEIPADVPLHSETTVPAVNGRQSSEPFAAFTRPGCYTVVATYAGDGHTNPFTSAFGEPSETVCVDAPAPTNSPEPEARQAPAPPAADDGPAARAVPPHRPELAQTGVRAEVAAGAALVLLGVGLACLHQGGASGRRLRRGTLP
ncbi:hypothetical protein GCM10027404_14460 [Arthrobacter tumbae]|uniref:hypothetical protein n=1 Tax=Arthrobacter tumbae TaxID=163874 RepID=UPI00195CA650|nr:hypothetical protein [Arthrobacter tumbae]MBM7782729.1 hypothetical protein [Arthrobacter tumbae]